MEEAIQFTTDLGKEGHKGPGKVIFSPEERFSSSKGENAKIGRIWGILAPLTERRFTETTRYFTEPGWVLE